MEGKVVVLTGASSGIGAALAPLLTASGAHVVLAARREKQLEEVKSACPGPGETLVVTMDITKRADHERLLAAAVAWKGGAVHVWVNNAGVGITKPVMELTDEDMDSMYLINTKGPLYGMQTVVPHFKAQGAGQIVNVSSLLGRLPMASVRSAYSAAKHALNSLTCNLRVDLKNEGFRDIHVSCCLPGPVATDFGLNVRHGGIDSRDLPNAQPVGEVADVLVALIKEPRADVYTRPQYQGAVAAYFSAERVEDVEAKPPFAVPPPKP